MHIVGYDHITASAFLGKVALRAVEQAGHSTRELACSSGVDWNLLEDDARVPFTKVIELWLQSYQLTGDENFGFSCASTVNPTSDHIVFCIAAACSSLSDAAHAIARYMSLFYDSAGFELTWHDNQATFRLLGTTLPSDLARGPAQFAFAMKLRFIERVAGETVTPTRVQFAHPEPKDRSTYRAWFGEAIAFDRKYDEITFSRRTLELPIVTASPVLKRLLTSLAEDDLKVTSGDDLFQFRMRERMMAALPAAGATLEHVAQGMGVSPRTLQRRLQEHGTNFADELERIRKNLAVVYLGSTKASIVDVALLLGFSDASAFSRAFRKWHGAAPSEFRHRRATELEM